MSAYDVPLLIAWSRFAPCMMLRSWVKIILSPMLWKTRTYYEFEVGKYASDNMHRTNIHRKICFGQPYKSIKRLAETHAPLHQCLSIYGAWMLLYHVCNLCIFTSTQPTHEFLKTMVLISWRFLNILSLWLKSVHPCGAAYALCSPWLWSKHSSGNFKMIPKIVFWNCVWSKHNSGNFKMIAKMKCWSFR